jgi:hypothetical protein
MSLVRTVIPNNLQDPGGHLLHSILLFLRVNPLRRLSFASEAVNILESGEMSTIHGLEVVSREGPIRGTMGVDGVLDLDIHENQTCRSIQALTAVKVNASVGEGSAVRKYSGYCTPSEFLPRKRASAMMLVKRGRAKMPVTAFAS